jgi:dTDP-glucose 4,6-dehydratase
VRLLVTGGAGFIGSHFVRAALGPGLPGLTVSRLTVLDALTYAGNLANLVPVVGDGRYHFVEGDIRDRALLDELLGDVDAVVNFAAETHVDRSIGDAGAFMGTNVVGAQTVFDAALRAGTPLVLHVSTDEVYGSIDAGSWTEDSPLRPNSPYAAAKASADLFARAAHITHGLPVVITRCSNNYGPYQFPEKVIPLFASRLLDGGQVPLYGDGRNVRDWLHVDDHCRGIAFALTSGTPGEIYNIGGGTELSNRELATLILDHFGADETRIDYVADRPGHDLRYSLDDSKLRSLGYAPRRSLASGLEETLEWYAQHEEWWRPLISDRHGTRTPDGRRS